MNRRYILLFIFAFVIASILTKIVQKELLNYQPFIDSFKTASEHVKYQSDGTFDRILYVDAKSGDDSNNGLSKGDAIQSLEQLAQMGIKAGDEILLKGGQTHRGTVELIGLNSGEQRSLIHIGSYGDKKATIDFSGYAAAVLIENSSDVVVSDLILTANGSGGASDYMVRPSDREKSYRYGVFVNALGKTIENITIEHLNVHDVYYYNVDDPNTPTGRPCREWSTNGEANYGWGIRALSRTKGSCIDGLTVRNCHIKDVSHTGIKMNGNLSSPIQNLLIEDCSISDAGGPGSQFSGVINGVMRHCKTVNPGSRNEPRKWGRGSGMWIHTSNGYLFEHNYYEGSQGIADCCGAHIDIGNKNVVIQYCLSKNNAGGFVEILGKNANCSYRYNISINDGWRNPKDAKQEELWRWTQKFATEEGDSVVKTIGTNGALVTVNGHTNSHFVGPYHSYIYNNTIVAPASRADGYTNPFIFELATSAQGILVMNNIFWIPAPMTTSWSGHWAKGDEVINNAFDFRVGERDEQGKVVVRDLTDQEIDALDFVVKNNLYQLYDPQHPTAANALPYNKEVADSRNRYWDENALGGDPQFMGVASEKMSAEDVVPCDARVINRGMVVEKLASDPTSYGILPQLEVTEDFFGKKIKKPIVGACVPRI